MPKDIQTSVPSDLLSRAMRLQGRARFMLDDVIVPTLEIGSLQCGFAPAPCRSAYVRGVQTAVAGEFAVFRFLIPEGVLAEITEIVASPASAGSLEIDLEDQLTASATTERGAPQFSDERVRANPSGPNQIPSGRLFSGTQAAGIAGEYAVPIDSPGTIYRPQDLIAGQAPIVAAGAIGFFFETAVNELAVLALQWREFQLV